MLCEAAFELISGHIDGVNTPDEEAALQAHLAACEDCRNTLIALTEIELDVRSMQVEPPAALKNNIMQAIHAEASEKEKKLPAGKPRRWLKSLYAVGAVAALLALVLGTGIVKLPGLGASYAKPEAAQMAQAPAETAAAEELYDSAEAAGTELPMVYSENTPALTEAAPEILFETGAPEEAAEELPSALPEQTMKSPTQTEAPAASEAQESTASHQEAEPESYVAGVPAAEADSVEASLTRRQMQSAGVSDLQDLDFCTELCVGQTTPMLVISGPSERFFTLVRLLAPELGALLDPEEAEQQDDCLVFTADFDTAAALAEWMELILPKSEEDETDESLDKLLAYDADNNCLKQLCPLPEGKELLLMREIFIALFGSDAGWSLIYPDSNYTPEAQTPSYIVLIPS